MFSPKTSERIAFAFLTLAIAIVVAFVFTIIFYITSNGIGAISTDFLTQGPKNRMTEGGIFPAIVGTVFLIIGSMAVALPLGILAAIYLNEYAEEGRIVWIIQMAINNLAGTPSVVFGLFGLAMFVKYMGFGASILAASLTLALVVLPVIIRASEEAMATVPPGLREASLALGVTRWQTVRKIVLPIALPGMVTGAILSVGRVAGETAPILLTGAAYFLPRLPTAISDQFMALPYHLFVLATSGTNIAATRPIQYGTALVLLLIVLGVNFVAVMIRRHYKKKMRW